MTKNVVACAVVTLLCIGSMLAQVGVEGSILGVVSDSTGAVVPGADVTVTNVETGLRKMIVTDNSGYFEVLALPRGSYEVAVTLPGFKTWKIENIELTAGEQRRLSPVLDVGEVTDEVIVQGAGELIQTEKGSLETTIGEKQIRDLPLNGRNPIELVKLVPGMRYLGQGGPERGFTVQGLGNRADATEFEVDGLSANAGMDETGIGIPNVDTVAEFNVQTSNFSAEHGRNPLQVIVVTKSGTNDFHGTLWEFHRNDALDAANAFAPFNTETQEKNKPKLVRNQFGFTAGGPILRDRAFFFGSYEGTRIRQEQIYNSFTVAPEMLQGDFSSISREIIDPLTGEPFPGNQIPEERIVSSAEFFFPFLLLPNSSGQRFREVAPRPNDTDEITIRGDYQITDNQRIYARWVHNNNEQIIPAYRPDIVQNNDTRHENVGINYNWSMTPTTLLTAGAGVIVSDNQFSSPATGQENLTQQAGIQGFPTEGRPEHIGLPTIGISGYTGIAMPWGTPGRLWMNAGGANASANLIRGDHSLSFGYEFQNRSTWGRHGSCCSRGIFDFNGQHTGDGFADYLLGLVASSSRNFPIQTFGMADSPYSGLFLQDFWRISPSVTLNLGLRLDYWHEKAFVRGNGGTFDVTRGKAVAGVDEDGNVDLNAQPVAPFLGEASQEHWISATEAGMPPGLFEATAFLSPRLGAAWRPFGNDDLVIRGGYGIFTSSFRGNATASSIVGPPYWTFESQGWSPSELQRWETAWPQDPEAFVTPSVVAPAFDVDPNKAHEWNLSIQRSLPFDSAITVSYVGNRMTDLITNLPHNEVPPGQYDNLQAAKPFPFFGAVTLYENIGDSWYNSLQLKMERRFTEGLSYMVSYAFSKHIEQNGASIWDTPTPFAPEGYNRGRSELDRTHILALNSVWEVPVGRGRSFATNLNPVVDAVLGGWQLTGIYQFTSGSPLSFGAPGATLGNGWSTRPNQVGDPEAAESTAEQWFNPAAFEAPPQFTFGNSGIGIMDGPGSHILDFALMKNFNITEEKFLQFRWEMFNAVNHVNLGNPVTTINRGNTATISGASDARQMQLGLKFIF